MYYRKRKKNYPFFWALPVLAIGVFVWATNLSINDSEPAAILPPDRNNPEISATSSQEFFLPENSNLPPIAEDTAEFVDLAVPFSSQAPFGEWSDTRQQDGCEEASALMAVYWARGLDLAPEEAKAVILEISDWEEKNYGSYVDTSADDTAGRIIRGYFGFENFTVKHDIAREDIIRELEQGNAVIVPADGQALGNPHFTAPGPERHNLLIRGYDPDTNEFITNDPGTRFGEGYRYDENILFNAIRDYPTGDHQPMLVKKKNMIVVGK